MTTKPAFRAEALKKLRSPEQLDNAFRLTQPVAWFTLVIIGVILAAAIAWGFSGRLPDQVKGMGVILRKNSSVYSITSPAMGRVKSIAVVTGQHVKVGDLICELALPDLESRRAGSIRMVADLRHQRAQLAQTVAQEVAARRSVLKSRIQALDEKIGADRQRAEYLRKVVAEEVDALRQGYVKRDELEATRTELFSVEQSMSDSRNAIASARTDDMNFEHEETRSLARLDQQILSEQNQLDTLNASIDSQKDVVSPVDGIVNEVSTKVDALVSTSQQLVSIEKSGSALRLVAYVPLTKGTLVKPGMAVGVSPTSVEANIYGAIRGTVADVSTLAVTKSLVTSTLGESGMAQEMTESGPVIQVDVALATDPSTESGLAWTSSQGPPLHITPGTTATVAITVRQDRPIDLVVPIYETWLAKR